MEENKKVEELKSEELENVNGGSVFDYYYTPMSGVPMREHQLNDKTPIDARFSNPLSDAENAIDPLAPTGAPGRR